MAKRGLPASADETLSRRTLFEWLGKGTVLALGGAALASCLGGATRPDGGLLGDAGPGPDGEGNGDGGGPGDGDGGEFPFEPGDLNQDVYSGWGERTVDRQDPASILSSWQLTVDGMVDQARVFTFAELIGLSRTDELMDFHCVEGWSVYDVPWNGVHMQRLFDLVGPRSAATHVTFHTIGGRYNESLPLAEALEPHTLLGYGVGGYTLPLQHGFPLRVVIPRLLGYKNAKYVERIELTDHPVNGYWVAAGYPYEGEVNPDRLRPGKY